ncbi:Charged multivesicular body protein 3, partial [Operophtera brumata]
MQAMQVLVRLPEVAATMQELSKEMMRAGIIEEMLDETMSSVLWELTQGKLGEAPAPPTAVGAPSTSKEEQE